MEFSKNSIWEFKDSDLAKDSIYRVLDIMQDVESVILFPLDTSIETVRPLAISINGFIEQVKNNKAKKSSFPLPNFLLVAEDLISEDHLSRRDKNYNRIKAIVLNRDFLFDYATKKRTPYLAEYAKSKGLDRKSLARLLAQYWRYGQDKMALLPAFSQSGALGKERKATNKPLGSPKQPRTLAVKRAEKYIVSDSDKLMFKIILKRYYLKESGMTLVKTYKKMLIEKYTDEIRHADACDIPPLVPTVKQFRYWSKKLFSKDETIKKRTSENDYLRNKRGLLGCITQDSFLPGAHFEIDATVPPVSE
jgi:putative transposase